MSSTHDLAVRALAHIDGEKAGGMAKAIEQGIPKLRIEEAAARTQARIDSGRQTVSVRQPLPGEGDETIDVLASIMPPSVRHSSKARPPAPNGTRRPRTGTPGPEQRRLGPWRGQLAGAGRRCREGEGDRRRDHQRWKRSTAATSRNPQHHRAPVKEAGAMESVGACRRAVETFAEAEGRRPRILIAGWAGRS
ncbi:MAG: methylmalonyl-CoA mutase family protein [Geminicoccaceae bacterium]